MMNLDAKTLLVFAYPLVSYTTSIALIWQINHMLGLDDDARSDARGRIHRYVKSMMKVRQILQENAVPLIGDNVNCNTIYDQNDHVKLFFLRLKDTSSELVQMAGDVKLDSKTILTGLHWFQYARQIAGHVSGLDEDDLNEIMNSIETNRICFLRNIRSRASSDNCKHFVHFCPKVAIIDKLTSVHIMLEKSYSQRWVGLCSKIFSLLGMNCGQYWKSQTSLHIGILPYGIELDLTKILFSPLEKNLLENKDNFAEDIAIMSVKALQFRMADLILTNESCTEQELEQGDDFSTAVKDLISSLEKSRCHSMNSNKASYACRPPKEHRTNNVGNQLKGFAFIMGEDEPDGDGLLTKLTRSMRPDSGYVNSNDEMMTPLQKRVSGWGVPTSMLNIDGNSPVRDLTAMLEGEQIVTRDSPTKRRRAKFTDEERELVMNGKDNGLKWEEIIARHSILSDNGRTVQNIMDMWKNHQKKKRRTIQSSKTTRKPFSLQEKLTVVDGRANGWEWAKIVRENQALLSGRSAVDIKDLWRTILNGIEDRRILNDHEKLKDHLRSSHNN